MIYEGLINDSRFQYLINKYLKNDGNDINYKEYFQHFLDNLNKNELIMPVLGVQGAGKSTFLNALLMDDNILPTDVDETTCVPVEVRFGSMKEAEVYFHDNKPSERINLNELNKYVHNDYNEANKLNIKKIIVYAENSLLKDGLVLVDLPGVGSLTPENQQTTLDYVNRLVSGIFMVRTNPPITRTEKNFISALWTKLSNTVFVQNRWNDENDEDAHDAKEHNENVLKSITIEHGEEKDINVTVVNVYEALKGRLSKDEELYNDSGIDNVIKDIKKISVEYNKNLEEALNIKLKECFKNIENKIVTYNTVASSESNDNEAEKERKIEELKTIISDNKKNFRQIRKNSEQNLDELISRASELIDEKIEKLLIDIKRIVDKGIVDGRRLSTIYKEMSDKAINDIMDEILKNISLIIKSLNEELGMITIKGFNGRYENISFFNKKSELKYENTLPSLLGVSGGIIGTITAASVLGGPIGILTGMGIGIAFSIVGDYMRNRILKNRAKLTMQDLRPMIEDLRSYLKEEILDDLRAKQLEIDDSMKNMRKNLEGNIKDDIKNIEYQYEREYTDEHIEQFNSDLKLLETLKNQYIVS